MQHEVDHLPIEAIVFRFSFVLPLLSASFGRNKFSSIRLDGCPQLFNSMSSS